VFEKQEKHYLLFKQILKYEFNKRGSTLIIQCNLKVALSLSFIPVLSHHCEFLENVCTVGYICLMTNKTHWNAIYRTKTPEELSWTEDVPRTSLDFIGTFNLPKDARIIDIGGGDSHLVDHLLAQGYKHITVLDISEEALHRARQRLGDKAASVQWIISDITDFRPMSAYDVWHDRATFHFLTTTSQITCYLSTARRAIHTGGYAVIGTFSDNGPEKCSGLPIRQYNEQDLTQELENGFKKIKCITKDHHTPFNTLQNFLFCSFKRA
jgi:SAM-dependent methyltransferase